MNSSFWQERWQSGRIGFHHNGVTPRLVQFWPALNLSPGSTVFVPLCGKSLDLLWLREHYVVAGVELSAIAIESLFMENGILGRRYARDGFDEYVASSLRMLCGDLFGLTPQMLVPVAGVYDRASLIALPPEMRAAYAEKLAEFATMGTQTVLITLEYPQHEMPGPPFSVDSLAVNRLYSPHHKIQELGRTDVLALDPLRARGLTRLHEVCYRLIRM